MSTMMCTSFLTHFTLFEFLLLLNLISCQRLSTKTGDGVKTGHGTSQGRFSGLKAYVHHRPVVVSGGVAEEARLILPQTTNAGKPLNDVMVQLEQKLILDFGGFTLFEGKGAWMDEAGKIFEDPIWIFDIAMKKNHQNIEELYKIAKWINKVAEQQSDYLREPGGKVTFVE